MTKAPKYNHRVDDIAHAFPRNITLLLRVPLSVVVVVVVIIGSTVRVTVTTAGSVAVAAMLAAIAASAAPDDGRTPPDTTALGHVIACTCQLVAFTAIVYALSAYCGVRIVQTAVHFGGRRNQHHQHHCRSDAVLPSLSEPGGAALDSADDPHHYGHRLRRKIKSAAPLLQR